MTTARPLSPTRTTAPFSGVVLVGGRSTRMGRDKARLDWKGLPLWQRQIGVLARAGCTPVRLALRRHQRSFGDPAREVRDARPDVGPLGGLHAALVASAGSEWVAVLAVDLPLIEPAWFRKLRRLCRPGSGAVVQTSDGFEPLAAIYPIAALPVVARRLEAGEFALQGLLAELVRRGLMLAVSPGRGQVGQVENWNEPGDVRRSAGSTRTRRRGRGRQA